MTEGMSISMGRNEGKVSPQTIKFGDSVEVQFPGDGLEPTRINISRIDGLLGERVHIEGRLPEISVWLDDKTNPTFGIRTLQKAFMLKVGSEQV